MKLFKVLKRSGGYQTLILTGYTDGRPSWHKVCWRRNKEEAVAEGERRTKTMQQPDKEAP